MTLCWSTWNMPGTSWCMATPLLESSDRNFIWGRQFYYITIGYQTRSQPGKTFSRVIQILLQGPWQ